MKLLLAFILLQLLDISNAKLGSYVRDYVSSFIKKQSHRSLNECATMAMPMISDFVETTISEIPNLVGQKVRVTSTLSPSDMAACTQKFCDTTDPCCNSCNSGLFMGNVALYTNDDVTPLGCSGTNCDYMNNCTYGANDNVMVQGTVESDDYGLAIAVEMHCKEDDADNSVSAGRAYGGDKDEHGCISSAGYTWCDEVQECVRLWETPCSTCNMEGCNSTAVTVGGDGDEFGCIASAGYVWCNEAQECVRPWETPCSTCNMEGCLDG